jgi:hypothetical protein
MGRRSNYTGGDISKLVGIDKNSDAYKTADNMIICTEEVAEDVLDVEIEIVDDSMDITSK